MTDPVTDATKGPIETEIEKRVGQTFSPKHYEIQNESHTHNVPKNSETHFRLIVVSEKFVGLSRLNRQRLVNDCLADLIAPGAIHALTQRALTPEEWEKEDAAANFVSPNCHGRAKI